jgi:hypothetical protein
MDEKQIEILMKQGMTESEAKEFMAGVHRGLEARKRGDIVNLDDVKKDLGIE